MSHALHRRNSNIIWFPTASFMLRVYAIMGLSRKAFIVAALLGMVGASTIGLDAVWIVCLVMHLFLMLPIISGKTFKSHVPQYRTLCKSSIPSSYRIFINWNFWNKDVRIGFATGGTRHIFNENTGTFSSYCPYFLPAGCLRCTYYKCLGLLCYQSLLYERTESILGSWPHHVSSTEPRCVHITWNVV